MKTARPMRNAACCLEASPISSAWSSSLRGSAPTGKLSLEPTELDVRQLLEQVTSGLGETGAGVLIEEGPDAPVRMVADPNRLTQVLTNLVHNAIKFSPPGGTVVLRWRTPAEGTVAFDVIDRGPGVPESEVGRIFERFHQRESSLTHT